MVGGRKAERGQALVEFGIIISVLFILTIGLVDAGRAFVTYNEVGAAARYGARWGSVVGGTCALKEEGSPTSDWCNQMGNGTGNFWAEAGNKPAGSMTAGQSCPSFSSTPADYYQTSQYKNATGTTIVGAVAQKIDSNPQGPNAVIGGLAPGLNLSNLYVCIAYTIFESTNNVPSPGDIVSVTVHYDFNAASGLLFKKTVSLDATSQYTVE
jgi:TadE-like protein